MSSAILDGADIGARKGGKMSELIERQRAIELVRDICDAIMSGCGCHYDAEVDDEVFDDILEVDAILKCNKEIRIGLQHLPSVQPEPSQVARDIADIIENEKDMRVIARSEITDEQAILHLQASGWMQRHDKEMYESGLRARLTDDSDSYDALLESVQPEQTRIFVELVVEYPDPELCTYKEYRGKPYYSIKYIENGETHIGFGTYKPEVLSQYLKENFISSVQPEQRWIPFKTRSLTEEEKEEHPEWDCILDCILPDNGQAILVSIDLKGHERVQYDEFYNDDGSYLDSGYEIGSEATAWMPLPEPYREKGGNK